MSQASTSTAAGVGEIVEDVRLRGDAAVAEWALRFDGVAPARALPGPGLPDQAVLAAQKQVSVAEVLWIVRNGLAVVLLTAAALLVLK